MVGNLTLNALSDNIGKNKSITIKKQFVRFNSIYAISLKYKKTTILFRDSYLLLNSSLSSLTRN